MDDFINEVNVQTEICTKTYKYLQPICPAVISASTIKIPVRSSPLKTKLLEVLASKILGLDRIINYNIDSNSDRDRDRHIGFIAMEYANNYELLYHKIKNSHKELNKEISEKKNEKLNVKLNVFKNMILSVMYLIIELAILGYNHADFHPGNILFDESDKTFIKGIQGRPILIDFGLVRKFTIEEHRIIKQYAEQERYVDILSSIYSQKRRDDVQLSEYVRFYGYIAGKYDLITEKEPLKTFFFPPFNNSEKVNSDLSQITRLRQEQIDENINTFNDEEKSEGNNLLLPLSSSSVNKIFRGIFPEISQKKNSTNKKYIITNKNSNSIRQSIFTEELPFANVDLQTNAHTRSRTRSRSRSRSRSRTRKYRETWV
jgi:hypothetical protein